MADKMFTLKVSDLSKNTESAIFKWLDLTWKFSLTSPFVVHFECYEKIYLDLTLAVAAVDPVSKKICCFKRMHFDHVTQDISLNWVSKEPIVIDEEILKKKYYGDWNIYIRIFPGNYCFNEGALKGLFMNNGLAEINITKEYISQIDELNNQNEEDIQNILGNNTHSNNRVEQKRCFEKLENEHLDYLTPKHSARSDEEQESSRSLCLWLCREFYYLFGMFVIVLLVLRIILLFATILPSPMEPSFTLLTCMLSLIARWYGFVPRFCSPEIKTIVGCQCTESVMLVKELEGKLHTEKEELVKNWLVEKYARGMFFNPNIPNGQS